MSRIHKIKCIKKVDKVHSHKCIHFALIKSTAGNKTRIFPSPFLISTRWLLILTQVFRNDHVAACSTALRSAAEKNEKGDYVTVTFSFKMTQRNSTADWCKF